MFCRNCGANIPDNSPVCPSCHMQLQSVRKQSRIDNIFSALAHDKSSKTIIEFVLWCIVCLMAILFMVAAIVVDNSETTYVTGDYMSIRRVVGLGGHTAMYIFMMLFTIGLGVILAFRLKAIALLYGATLFQLIMAIVYYVANSGMIGAVQDYFERVYNRYIEASYPAFITVLFVIVLLVGIGCVTCLAIHMFSKINLGKIAAILSVVQAVLTLLLSILMYALPSFDILDFGEREMNRQTWAENFLDEVFGCSGYWFGSIIFFLFLAFLATYMMLFFFGVIDKKKDKIFVPSNRTGNVPVSGTTGMTGFQPGMQCQQGAYMGQMIYLQGQELTIGSQPGVSLLLQDSYVSHQHCRIRFNPSTGYYEVLDVSTNGVYDLATRTRLQRGVYTSCPRGMVLCIGSMGQQFRLL